MTPVGRMDSNTLNHYVVDCSRKEEQIAFIQSQRPTGNERVVSRLLNDWSKWDMIFDPKAYNLRNSVGYGQHDWLINQILMELEQCPDY